MIQVRRALRAPLLWLSVLYLLTGAAYALLPPMFEKPDEDGHYGYVRYLHEHRALPPLTFDEGFPSEYKQPPLYYLLVAALTAPLPDAAEPAQLPPTNPYMDHAVPGLRADNRNVFLHPPHLTPLTLAGRLVSLLFGLGTVLVTHRLGQQLFPDAPAVPLAAAAMVGFQPQFLYVATAFNNDAAITFLGAAIITQLFVRRQQAPSPRFALGLGVLLGLAAVTKVSGLVFLPLTGLALFVIHLRRGFRPTFWRESAVILAVALLVGGWWYARNGLLYGDPLSVNVHTLTGAPSGPLSARIWHDLRSLEHSFWANLSRTFVAPNGLERALIWWGRIGLVALLLTPLFRCWRRRRGADALPPESGRDLSAWAILASWPAAFLALLLTFWSREGAWAYGRLLFPALAPLGVLWAWGWWDLFPARWPSVSLEGWRRVVLALATGGLVVAGVVTPWASIYPLYHPWRTGRGQPVDHPLDVRYVTLERGTPIARLIGYTVLEPFAEPGAYLPVEVCWEPLGHTDAPYAVFVHLLDLSQPDAPGVWGGRRSYPGLGNRPTDRWPLGEPFCDRVLVPVSPAAPTPLAAAVEIGLIDPTSGERLPAISTDGQPLDIVAGRGAPVISGPPPATAPPVGYILDHSIELRGLDWHWGDKDTLTVTLTWQSRRPVSYDATTFVHLIGATGKSLAQADRPPLDGRFPTSYWLPGQIVTDVVRLTPASLPRADENALTLTVGMYTWPALDRLPVTDAEGVPQPDNLILNPISAPSEQRRGGHDE